MSLVGLDHVGVSSPLDAAACVIRLAGFEGVAETADRAAGKWLRPDTSQRLGQVTANQRPHVLEFLLRAGAHLHDAKIGVYCIDPERRMFDELTKGDFASAQMLLGAFEAGDVGESRDQPNDFAVHPLRLVPAMHELRLADLVRRFDLDLELGRLAGEALADVTLKGSVGFFTEHLGNSLADYLPRREAETLHIMRNGLPVS